MKVLRGLPAPGNGYHARQDGQKEWNQQATGSRETRPLCREIWQNWEDLCRENWQDRGERATLHSGTGAGGPWTLIASYQPSRAYLPAVTAPPASRGTAHLWPLWDPGGQAPCQSVNHTATSKEPCMYITWAYPCTCSVLLTYKHITRHHLYVLNYTSFYLFPGGRTVVTCRMGF